MPEVRGQGGFMENEKIMTLQLQLTRRKALFLLTAFFIAWHPRFLGSETLTLTTYYPAPFGGYVGLLSTGGTPAQPVNTLLARDAGFVGIGTNNPLNKVHIVSPAGGGSVDLRVNGRIMTGDGASAGGIWLSNAGDGFVGNVGGNVGFWTNGVGWNALQIVKGTGFVGIGTQAPQDKLHVLDGNVRIASANPALGFLSGICVKRNYIYGGITACQPGERVMSHYGNGVIQYLVLMKIAGAPPEIQVAIGQDWGGTMMCCKIKDGV